MMNCASCGKEMLDDMRFCPYCGQQVLSDDSEHFETAKGEIVTAVISPSKVSGRKGTFAIALTERRLVFIVIDTVVGDRTKGDLLQKGIFLPGSSQSANVSRFYEMTPEQVLATSPDNFQLENDEVDAVKLAYDGDSSSYLATMRHGDERLTFSMPYDRYYRDLLFRLFEDRMSW